MQTKFQRRKIHTRVKFLTYMNALPEQYKSQLHPSQIYRYKTTFNETAYFGYELSSIEQSLIGALQQLNQHASDRKIIFACLRLLVILRQVFSKAKHFNRTLCKGKFQIVEIVQRYHSVIPVARFASLLKVSESTIRQWVRQVRVQCSHTITNLCRKTHPNQLLESEVQVMKQLLTIELYKHWPLVSIYYEALTKNVVAMCLSTWYKYVQLLGINRPRPKRSKVYGKSIVASCPNEVWHADVTQFRTLDGTLHYIYLVVDNYSKHVLAWAIDTVLSGAIRTRTFKAAVKTAATSFFTAGSVQLVVDGGSENNNKTVDAFISELEDIELTKVIALKTVSFSNAMAEATNRILKTYYLNQQPLYNTAALMAATERAIYDITVVRPHGQLGGLTPYLAYNGQKADSLRLSQYKMTARLNRIAANQNFICCKGKF